MPIHKAKYAVSHRGAVLRTSLLKMEDTVDQDTLIQYNNDTFAKNTSTLP